MKFLVGYDGSNSAKEALKLVTQYAKRFDAMVEVIASIEGDLPTKRLRCNKHAKISNMLRHD
jgi:hypothetical protein